MKYLNIRTIIQYINDSRLYPLYESTLDVLNNILENNEYYKNSEDILTYIDDELRKYSNDKLIKIGMSLDIIIAYKFNNTMQHRHDRYKQFDYPIQAIIEAITMCNLLDTLSKNDVHNIIEEEFGEVIATICNIANKDKSYIYDILSNMEISELADLLFSAIAFDNEQDIKIIESDKTKNILREKLETYKFNKDTILKMAIVQKENRKYAWNNCTFNIEECIILKIFKRIL